MANYPNITIRFNDSNGFVVPPTSYLKDDSTAQGVPICYNMVIGNFLQGNKIVLGDVFMENYQVLYDYGNTTIGFNGWILQDLPVEPSRRNSSTATMLAVILGVGGGLIVIFIVAIVCVRRRNARLGSKLDQYNQLEAGKSGAGEIYQKPQIVKESYTTHD